MLIKIVKAIFGFLLDTMTETDEELRLIEQMTAANLVKMSEMKTGPDALSFFPYRNPLIKKMLIELKESGNKNIAELLGKTMRDLVSSEIEDLDTFDGFRSPLLIPIPVTKKRMRERGFNQCELLVKAIRRADAMNMFEIETRALVKIRETEDQVGKNREERLENLKECFSVKDPEKVFERNVIVIDDIKTTGATLGEARRALIAAGVRRVLCVAVAG
jgi:competence protein ComFC